MNRYLFTALVAASLSVVPAHARLSLAEARALGLATDPMIRQNPGSRSLPVITPGGTKAAAPDLKRADIARLSGKGSAVYGYLGFADEYRFIPAMCELDGHAFARTWDDARYISDEAIMSAGWINGDKVCGVSVLSFMGMTLATYNVECDLGSGQTILFQELPDGTPVFSCAAYDKSDGNLYGIVFRDQHYYFAKAPVNSPNAITEICETPEQLHLISITYCDDDKTIYGVNMAGEFLKVAHDGSFTVLSRLQVPNQIAGYYTGLVYVPTDKEFIWNVNYQDYTAALYRIDPETYELTEFAPCPSNEQYIFMGCPDGAYDGEAPCRPQVGELDFPKGDLSGSVSFVLPAALQDGTPITGEISYVITLDRKEHTSGKAAPGTVVKGEFKGLTQGYHTFGIRSEADGHEAPLQLVSAYLGQDVPLPPTGVSLSADGLVKWNPVTEGINGGYVDVEGMRYHIYFEDDEVGETGDTSFKMELPSDRPIAPYTVSVAAEYDNNWSDISVSNYVVTGQPLEIPVELAPTREQMMTFTSADANDSGNIWRFDSGDLSMKLIVREGEADAWLFTPLIHFPSSDVYYTFAYDASALRASDPAAELSVYVGPVDEPDRMTLMGEPFSPSVGFAPYECLLKVDKPGDYVVAFRCTAAEGAYGAGVKNMVLVDGGVTPDSPARATELSATPAARGALKARVDFTFPTTDVAGNPLPEDTRLRAVVAGESKAVANGRPGEKAYATVNTLQGNNRLSVTVSIDGKNSPVAYVNTYTGVVIPESPTGIAYMTSEDMMSIDLMWSPVSTGVDGGYVDPNDITYTLFRYEETPYTSTWRPVIEGITGNTCTYDLPADAPQEMVRLGVCAVNAAGRSENMVVAAVVAGKTWDLPMVDNFAEAGDDGAAYYPFVNYRVDSSYNGMFVFMTPEEMGSEFADQTGFYFVAAGAPGDKVRLGLPCFNTKDGRAQIEFTALCGNGYAPLSLYVDCGAYDGPQLLGTMPSEGGLVSRTFLLPETSANRGWVQILVDGTMVDGDMLAFRGYAITYADGVSSTDADRMGVRGGKGELTVSGAAGKRVDVFTADGRKAAGTLRASASETFSLAPGIYMVMAGEKVVKCVVF